MAKKNQGSAQADESKRESVSLRQSTRISGASVEAGDSVDVYPFERRHLVSAGLAEGSIEDTASPAEIEQGNLEVLKPLSERENFIPPEDEEWFASGDEGVVAGEEGSNVSGNANPQA